MLKLIETERAAISGGAPTMLIMLLAQPDLEHRDLSTLRCILAGGATVPPELVRDVERRLNVRFSIGYGQTEASPFITQTHLEDDAVDRAETVGGPYPQTEVKIVDARTGGVMPIGGVGEICTRGYHVMHGYFENPEATAQTIDSEGWLHTGDLGSMDERGYVRIEGRVKDMIIRGGENIYPREIEDLLITHSTVAEAAVIGVPDGTWGERVVAFIRPAAGQQPSGDELFAYCRAHLAPHKTPREWVMVDAFPMTPSGKVQKFVLRDQFLAAAQQRS
jgi:fatty-acyl-CoA synthase